MLSRKAQYAIRAVSYLAAGKDNRPVSILELSVNNTIPLKFLEQILLQLKNAGVLDSKKGKGGGYFFGCDPASVTLAQIIRLIDGPISLFPCVSLYFYQECGNCREPDCRIKRVFSEARDATLSVLDKRTILDIAQENKPAAEIQTAPAGHSILKAKGSADNR